MKKLVVLVDRIEKLQDKVHRLMIGRDRLKAQLAAAQQGELSTEQQIKSLDSGTQFKVFDRSMKRLCELSKALLENNSLWTMIDIIKDEVRIAVAENIERGGL